MRRRATNEEGKARNGNGERQREGGDSGKATSTHLYTLSCISQNAPVVASMWRSIASTFRATASGFQSVTATLSDFNTGKNFEKKINK